MTGTSSWQSWSGLTTVFTSPRRVVFRETEYAVARAVGIQALTEVRALIDRSGWRISFPVEVRHAPRDDIWLSTAHDRDSVYLALHVNARTDHGAYLAGVEQVLRGYDGRPHWGKLHTRTAEDLAPRTPASPTSSRCGTGSTPTGSSPTTIWNEC